MSTAIQAIVLQSIFPWDNAVSTITVRNHADTQTNVSIYDSGGVYIGQSPSDPLAGGLHVEGALTVGGLTSLQGISTPPLTAYATGGVYVGNPPSDPGTGNLVVKNDLKAVTAEISGAATVGGTLGVTGTGTFTGNVHAASGTITGDLTAATEEISGNATVGGTFGVTGATTLTGLATLNGGATLGGRLQGAMGSNVASANNMTLGPSANYFQISGAVQMNLLDTTGWQAGSIVTLRFLGAPLVKHGQVTSGAFKGYFLLGAVDFQAAGSSNLTLVYDGSGWVEIARKAT